MKKAAAPSPTTPTNPPLSIPTTWPTESEDVLLTRPELARRWQCSVGHLANLASADRGPTYIKLGSTVRYRLADVCAYEKSLEVRTSEAAAMGLCA